MFWPTTTISGTKGYLLHCIKPNNISSYARLAYVIHTSGWRQMLSRFRCPNLPPRITCSMLYKTAEHHISILAKGERKWRKLLILLCGSNSYISFSFSFTVLVELCEGLLFAASPVIPSAPKMPISLSSIWVIRFHPSHRLFSCLRNHSTVGLTMPLGD